MDASEPNHGMNPHPHQFFQNKVHLANKRNDCFKVAHFDILRVLLPFLFIK